MENERIGKVATKHRRNKLIQNKNMDHSRTPLQG